MASYMCIKTVASSNFQNITPQFIFMLTLHYVKVTVNLILF